MYVNAGAAAHHGSGILSLYALIAAAGQNGMSKRASSIKRRLYCRTDYIGVRYIGHVPRISISRRAGEMRAQKSSSSAGRIGAMLK